MAAAEAWDIGRGVSGYVWRSSGSRANLLLAHGFAEYAERYLEHYHRLIPQLATLGLDVYAFDLRGHGRSPGARGVTDMNGAVADHLAARRILAAQGKPLFLFGHSLGGLLTAASAARDQTGLSGVILSAPAILIEAPPQLRALASVFSVLAPSLRLAPPLDTAGLSRIPEEVAAYQSDPMVSDPRVPAKTGATAMAVAEDAWRRYPNWTVPTLVLHGEADTATAVEGSKRFVSIIGATDKHLELYPQGRHELLNDLDRDAALDVILSWLRQRLPS